MLIDFPHFVTVALFSGCPSVRSFVRSSGQIFIPRYLVNGFNNFDTTDKKYSSASTDDMTWLWRLKVKGQGHTRPSRSNLVNEGTISCVLLQQSRWNLKVFSISPYSSPDCILEVKSQRSRSHTLVQVCGGDGVHVDAVASKSIFLFRRLHEFVSELAFSGGMSLRGHGDMPPVKSYKNITDHFTVPRNYHSESDRCLCVYENRIKWPLTQIFGSHWSHLVRRSRSHYIVSIDWEVKVELDKPVTAMWLKSRPDLLETVNK